METIDPNDTMIHTDIIKAINETVQDQLAAFRDTSCEAQTDSGATHSIVLTAYAIQVVFALEIDVYVGVMHIHVLTHPYEPCHVLDVVVHNVH